MIAIVSVQYWDRSTWKTAYPRAYKLPDEISGPDNVKRFIIGRQVISIQFKNKYLIEK